MALVIRKALLDNICPPLMQAKRFRGKINVQKPRKPHFERALFFEVARPILPFKYEDLKTFERCSNITSANRPVEPENPYVKLIAKEALNLFEKSKLVAFFHMNPVPIEQRFRLDRALKKQNMLMKTYGKKTLQAAFEGTPYKDAVLPFYVSHNMITFCAEPNIKTLMRITKKFPQFILLAGIYENKFLSKDELVYYSTIPNLQTAQAGLVQTLNSIGGTIVNQLNSHQTTLVSQLQERVKQLEEEK